MFVDVTAVLDDGVRPFAGWVPGRPRHAVNVTRGEDITFRVDLVNPAGRPVDLAIGGADSMTLTARTPFERGVHGMRKLFARPAAKASARGRGKYDLLVPGTDTRWLPPMSAVFDIQVRRPAVTAAVLWSSRMVLSDSMIDPSGTAAPPVPGPDPAPQDQQMRTFTFVWPADGLTALVNLPDVGMRDASYLAWGMVPPPIGPIWCGSDPATQTAAYFTLTSEVPIAAGTTVVVYTRDL